MKRMDRKGKGKAMSPISIVESEDEDSSYRVSDISRGSGKEIGDQSSEKEVCLFHDLIHVLTFI